MKLIIFLIGIALFAGSAKADPLSPRAFTETAAAAAKTALPSATVTVTADLQLQTRTASGEYAIPRTRTT